jgi:hypothetical protein
MVHLIPLLINISARSSGEAVCASSRSRHLTLEVLCESTDEYSYLRTVLHLCVRVRITSGSDCITT